MTPIPPASLRFQSASFQKPRHRELPPDPAELKEAYQLDRIVIASGLGMLGGLAYGIWEGAPLENPSWLTKFFWPLVPGWGGSMAAMLGMHTLESLGSAVNHAKNWLSFHSKIRGAGTAMQGQTLVDSLAKAETLIQSSQHADAFAILTHVDSGFDAALKLEEATPDNPETIRKIQILSAKTKGYLGHLIQRRPETIFDTPEMADQYYSQAWALLLDAVPVVKAIRIAGLTSEKLPQETQEIFQDRVDRLPELQLEGYQLAFEVAVNRAQLCHQLQRLPLAAGFADTAIKLGQYIHDADTPVMMHLKILRDKLEAKQENN